MKEWVWLENEVKVVEGRLLGWLRPSVPATLNPDMSSPSIKLSVDDRVVDTIAIPLPGAVADALTILAFLLPSADLTVLITATLSDTGAPEIVAFGKTYTLDLPEALDNVLKGYEAITGSKPSVGVSVTL